MPVLRWVDDATRPSRWVLGRAKDRIGPLIAFSVAFSLMESALLGPLAAGILRVALDTWGRCSVGNFEIVAFLLSPVGLAGLTFLAAVQLFTFYLRLTGLMAVLSGDGPGLWHTARVARRLPTLIRVNVVQAILYVLLAAPFAAAGVFAYARLWGAHDLNRLVVTRPPEFWRGVVVMGGVLLLFLAAAGGLYLRWLFSIPAVLFEDATTAWAALRSSARRTRGRIGLLAVTVLATLAVFAAIEVGVIWALGAISGWVLNHAGGSLRSAIPTTAALLVGNGLVAAGLGALAALIFAGIILIRYQEAGGVASPAPAAATDRRWSWAALGLSAVAAVLATLSALKVLDDSRVVDSIEITAHRAGAAVAPENTLAALRRAIEDGAEWAEIDVQLTSDDQLAVIHDSDLLRVGGSPLRVASATMDQLRQVDIGAWFGPEFAGERVSTLEEFLDAAGTDIGLNIELKASNPAQIPALVNRVLEAVRSADGIGRHRICAESFQAVELVRRLEPRIEVGSVAGAVLGDPSRLDVDFLMVERRLATRTLVDRARLRGVQIHAWTINNPERLATLIDNGVANVITDDVAAIHARLAELGELEPLERLLLRARNGLVGR